VNPIVTALEPTVEVHLHDADLDAALRADVARGLTAEPKELPPKWFYDERGSELFDRITRLPEYYPTNAEREILVAEAATIVEIAGADTMVELGSGTSDKTRALLSAGREAETLERFVPFDVSEEFLRHSASVLAEAYPGLAIHGVVGDFDRHLHHLAGDGRRLLALLGGTIGNYRAEPRRKLLDDIAATMEPGDHFLLGTDLVKDRDRLVRAYDDSAGVTAAFNRNVLSVINRTLAADFVVDRFEHVARWNADTEWIEMLLRSREEQTVRVDALDLDVDFAAGELMRTEVSCKFRRDRVVHELDDAGFDVVQWWTDAAGDYGLSLAVRR